MQIRSSLPDLAIRMLKLAFIGLAASSKESDEEPQFIEVGDFSTLLAE